MDTVMIIVLAGLNGWMIGSFVGEATWRSKLPRRWRFVTGLFIMLVVIALNSAYLYKSI